MKKMSIFLQALLLLFISGAPTLAEEKKDNLDWSGQWQTFWRDGQALLTLTQEEEKVTGFYSPQDGQVEAEVEGRLIKGRWKGDDAAGGFVFALSPDGQTFTGRFDSGEYWNGRRLAEKRERFVAFSSAISPQETLRTVITAANRAVFEGNAAALQTYERLLLYEGEKASGREQTRRRNLLWQILNMSTFRVYSAPNRPQGDTATFDSVRR
jgi:hypothetical protein